MGLCGGEGVYVLADDAVAFVDGPAGFAVDVDGCGVVLVGPLDDDEGVAECGVRVGGVGHHLDGDVELAGGSGDVA